MRIVIAPYSAQLRSGRTNAKSYPWWTELVALINCDTVQVGIKGEDRIKGVGEFLQDFPLPKLRRVIEEADGWVSVDSWLPHFCQAERLKAGVVLWGPSDPLVFGYPANLNILKDRKYLRPLQFQDWQGVVHNYDAFVRPELVASQVLDFFRC